MRYYCHHCHTQINADELLPDFTCPSCRSGFVEEIPAHGSRRDSSVDESNRGGSDDGAPGFTSTRMSSDEYSDDNSDVEFLDAVNGQLSQVFGLFQSQQPPQTLATQNAGQSSQQPHSDATNTNNTHPQAQAAHVINRTIGRPLAGRTSTPLGQVHTAYLDSNSNQSLAEVLQDFITGVSFGTHLPEGAPPAGQSGQGSSGGGSVPANRGLINIDFPLPFFLHSNPGDYAWGNAGFDAVITQLLNNLDGSNSGPPPMPKDQVESLPTVKINGDQVKNSNLQCTVCMDDFQVGDSARQLPCEHFFHQDCILPWLKLHASCPICRKTFVSGTNATHNLSSDPSNEASNASTSVNSHENVANSGSNVVSDLEAATNRATSSSTTTVANQNLAPRYDYTEDDCD